MSAHSPALFLGIGELLWDVFPDQRRPGGAPANVAWHAAHLGLRGLVISRVGRDEAGRALRAELEQRGLDCSGVQEDAARPTGTVDVDLTDPNAPRFTIREGVAWDAIAFTPALEAAAAEARAVCFGTLAQRAATTRLTVHAALAAAPRALRIYDVNLRQSWYARDWIEPSLRAADIVKLNREEVAVLARLLEIPSADPRRFAAHLREAYAVGTVCVTRGADGCLVVAGDEVADVPGHAVDVVDAVGAGDAFTAAFVAARLQRAPLAIAAAFANEVGASVAGAAGAMPDLGAVYTELRARHGIG